ncbi:glycosyl hydrolase [Streptomyces sp. NPDC060194]|uniref:glycoside hydrolase 5 family protein n=1 Tax=Streptomyces sp. NPDC060194 TaxID=3347069 RepID=UPI003646575C
MDTHHPNQSTARHPSGTPRFGVNYVPSRNWWYCWNDWDADAVLADLRALAGLGLDHIRIQLIWPVFQPNPAFVSPAALGRLRELLDLADRPDTGLDVMVSVLDGWLSGFTFEPVWVRGRNMITDAEVVAAELHLLDVLAGTVADHPRFLGFDLGNEISVITGGTPSDEGDRWAARLLDHCARIAPGGFHVNGHDHRPWLHGEVFTPGGAATSGSASVFHSYPYWTGVLERWGPDGTGTLHLAEFMAELAGAHAPGPGRPKWLQEFGASPVERPDASIPGWAETFVRNALTSADVWGCTWWGSHDIDRGLTGFDPYEYELGLLTVDNEVKPVGAAIASLVASVRRNPPRPLPRTTALVLAKDAETLDVADRFFRCIEDGVRPALVTAERVHDEAHLTARGITEVVHV